MRKKKLKWLRKIRDFFFPPRCTFCRRSLPAGTEHLICIACENNLPYCLAADRCQRCGKPVEDGERCCRFCKSFQNSPYVRISAPYMYQDAVRSALLRFKHERYRCYADVFARHMRAVVKHDCREVEFDCVVSVPPRLERMRREGYDQAACLAQKLSAEMGIPRADGVLRQRENRQKQSGLGYGERLENAKGNFVVQKPGSIVGKTVLLVDDICTTRATLWHCAFALRNAGAASVYCVTVATTAGENRTEKHSEKND